MSRWQGPFDMCRVCHVYLEAVTGEPCGKCRERTDAGRGKPAVVPKAKAKAVKRPRKEATGGEGLF